ncbi:hypothetical protein GA0074696_3396 [Micromonospora purpureochromogenes]|uniref:Uncharacterized protein n=1 Tax=Micromonospora purpureochromogenes TaxID=47872 RepID=A0A1C4YI08_9ACTN|nr:hypothetical protein [Micromonospora purpureochromogenes]SCF20276.1 hypothetical protein GA0074696_3396 [Micromonospora purpureochromogenes]
MHPPAADADSRLSFWRRVREFAVPASMIETATVRRRAGDWAGACAAAHVDVDPSLRAVARTHGRELAARVRADLRELTPDLLRWHLPRIAPDGLLRPGLTIALARYDAAGRDGHAVHLVARTPPAWADAGQRFSLALWDGHRDGRHPHPHPDRRFRLDLHRHLWDARRADELRTRSGADRLPADRHPALDAGPSPAAPPGLNCAVDRWAAEAEILLRAEGRTGGAVAVRLGRRRLVLQVNPDGGVLRSPSVVARRAEELPVLPDAATWVLPDLALLRAGLIEVDRLHPLVASALAPEHRAAGVPWVPQRAGQPRLVRCRGAQHRIGLVDGVLVALDHDPAEVRREELLAALTGTPLACLRAIDEAHRHPECLDDVRARLDHGDSAGALAAVEALLGPDALLRAGALRDELETAASRRVTYGLFRAGLAGSGPGPEHADRRRTRDRRSRPRHGSSR